MEDSAPLKSYTKKELYHLYKADTTLCEATFRKWIKGIEKHLPNYTRNQRILTKIQVQAIFDNLGEP